MFVTMTPSPPCHHQADGFVDPSTNKVRRVPFEVMVRGDKTPVYEETLEDNGRFNEQPVLPFNAFGTMAMARGEFDTNSASSQVFFLLKVGFVGFWCFWWGLVGFWWVLATHALLLGAVSCHIISGVGADPHWQQPA